MALRTWHQLRKDQYAEREQHIRDALLYGGWSQAKAARLIGVPYPSFRKLVERYGLQRCAEPIDPPCGGVSGGGS